MVHTIQLTEEARIKMNRIELTWQTRAICTFISSTVEDDKSRSALFKQAQQLTLLEDDEMVEDDTTSERSLEDIIENGNVSEALAKNNRRNGPNLSTVAGGMVHGQRIAA